ncbi:HWE histidine kinase domain-containing protein [Phyllobacterium sp. OV277]|uniref:sensor histidine kinase n=1 Tax=Phyllobacterium sp. OV277 TaxID=1882772 RepID=UPI00088EBEFE|nr:HWE histidine kinase domain-containing protein [Phyllobacterium sp. OV277]SDO70150.1 PAS domain S-box-containing protein [Phyllobacterium sp. OV277]
MKSGHISENMSESLSAPARLDVLSAVSQLEFQSDELYDLVSLALSLSGSDVAQIVLVGENQNQILTQAGTISNRSPDLWVFGAGALAFSGDDCLVIPDARADKRFSDNHAVSAAQGVRFVAAVPVRVEEEPVGALIIASVEPVHAIAPQLQSQLNRVARLAGSFLGLKRDAQSRTNSIATLHRDELRNDMALEVGNVGSWVWDLKTGKFTGNKMAYSMLGLKDDKPINGEDVFRAMHPDDFPLMKSAFTRALAHNQDYVGEFRAASSGQWLLGRGRIFERDAAGKPLVAVGVNIDITSTRNAAEKTRLLLRELNHRVKNTLAMLQSLARQTLNRTSDPAEFMEAFSGRLRAISEAHTLLSDREWSGISLIDLITKQVEPYAIYDPSQVILEGEDMVLPPDHALGLGIALHELATNAAKHGALSSAHGRVRVSWQTEPGLDESRVVIHWVETDGPRVTPPAARGLGERLIERSLDKVLSSSVRLSYPETGMEVLISMPIKESSNIVVG